MKCPSFYFLILIWIRNQKICCASYLTILNLSVSRSTVSLLMAKIVWPSNCSTLKLCDHHYTPNNWQQRNTSGSIFHNHFYWEHCIWLTMWLQQKVHDQKTQCIHRCEFHFVDSSEFVLQVQVIKQYKSKLLQLFKHEAINSPIINCHLHIAQVHKRGKSICRVISVYIILN